MPRPPRDAIVADTHAVETVSARGRHDEATATLFGEALLTGALPGETDGLDGQALLEIGDFVAGAAQSRTKGQSVVLVRPHQRRTWVAIVNDDMPFLVDSISAAVTASGLTIERLLHPIIAARRDAEGRILGLSPRGHGPGVHEVTHIPRIAAQRRARPRCARSGASRNPRPGPDGGRGLAGDAGGST